MAIRTDNIALKVTSTVISLGTCIVDMSKSTQSYTLTADTSFTATNMSASTQHNVTLILKTGVDPVNLTFSNDWNWSNLAPTKMGANETIVLELQSVGANNSDIYITNDSLPDSELNVLDNRGNNLIPQDYYRGLNVELKTDTDLSISADGLAGLFTVKPWSNDVNVYATQFLMNSQGLKYRNGRIDQSNDWSSWSTIADRAWVTNEINTVINSAPDTLNTLNELAAALGDDPNFATTITNQLGNKVDKVAGKGLSTNDYTDADKTLVDSIPNKVDIIAGKGLSTNDYTDTDKTLVGNINNKVDKVAGKGLSTNDLTDVLLGKLWTSDNLTHLSQLNNDLPPGAGIDSISGPGNGTVTFTLSDASTIDHDFSHTHNYLPLSGGTLTGDLVLTAGTSINSSYNGLGFILDHNNGNITYNAVGGEIYVGSANTTKINIAQALNITGDVILGTPSQKLIWDTTGNLTVNYLVYNNWKSSASGGLTIENTAGNIYINSTNFISSADTHLFKSKDSGITFLQVDTDNIISKSKLIIEDNTSSPITLKTGTSDHGYIEYFTDAANQSNRTAWIGFGAIGSNTLTISNQKGDSYIRISDTLAEISENLQVDGSITTTSHGTSVNWKAAYDHSQSAHNYRLDNWVPDWTDVQNKPTEFTPESHNHDSLYVNITGDTITGSLKSTNSNAFITKNSGNKSWVLHHPNTNNLIFAPSATIDGEDWEWSKQIVFTDTGSLTLAGNTVYHSNNINKSDTSITTYDLNTHGTIRHNNITTGNTQVLTATTNSIYLGNPITQMILESNSVPNVYHDGASYQMFTTGHLPTWDEVDNKPTEFNPSSHNHDSSYFTYKGNAPANWNDALEHGVYDVSSLGTNAPTDAYGFGFLVVHKGSSTSYVQQTYYADRNSGESYTRTLWLGTWRSWSKIWTSGTLTDNSTNWDTAYSWGNHSGLYINRTGDTVTGNFTFNGSIKIGNATIFPYGNDLRMDQKLVFGGSNSEGGLITLNTGATQEGLTVRGLATGSISAFKVNDYNTDYVYIDLQTDGSAYFDGIITTSGGNSSNWNTAFGWGNHATMQYLRKDISQTVNAETIWSGENKIYLGSSNNGLRLHDTNTVSMITALNHTFYIRSYGLGEYINITTRDSGSTDRVMIQIGGNTPNIKLNYNGDNKLETISTGINLVDDELVISDKDNATNSKLRFLSNQTSNNYIQVGVDGTDGGSNLTLSRYNTVSENFNVFNVYANTSNIQGHLNAKNGFEAGTSGVKRFEATGSGVSIVGTVTTDTHGTSANWNSAYDHSLSAHNYLPLSGGTISGTILPNAASTLNLGSAALPFNEIHTDELFVSANSLYVNGKKVIQDDASTITVSTDVDQDLRLKTTGLGDINIVSDNTVTTQADGGMTFSVPADLASKNIDFSNYSVGGDISFNAMGTNSRVRLFSNTEIILTAPDVTASGKVTADGGDSSQWNTAYGWGDHSGLYISRNGDTVTGTFNVTGDFNVTGNITQSGNPYVTEAEYVKVKNNLSILNESETGAGVSTVLDGTSIPFSGWEIERGTEENFFFGFDEDIDRFVVGKKNSLQQLVAMDSNLTNGQLVAYNTTTKRLENVPENSAFNKAFGTTSGTVVEGNDSRIINGETAYGWGDHSTQGYLKETVANFFKQMQTFQSINSINFRDKTSDDAKTFGDFDFQNISTNEGNFRFGRQTNTTGPLYTRFYLGDNTGTVSVTINHKSGLISTISDGNSSQWNTAYGWGDHSTENYLKTVDLNSDVTGILPVSMGGTGVTTFDAPNIAYLNKANQEFNGKQLIRGAGELLVIGDNNANNDDYILFGGEGTVVGWRLKYLGTTTGTDNNSFRIESTNSLGKYWEYDHDGNFEYYDGSSLQTMYHSGNINTKDINITANDFISGDSTQTTGFNSKLSTNALTFFQNGSNMSFIDVRRDQAASHDGGFGIRSSYAGANHEYTAIFRHSNVSLYQEGSLRFQTISDGTQTHGNHTTTGYNYFNGLESTGDFTGRNSIVRHTTNHNGTLYLQKLGTDTGEDFILKAWYGSTTIGSGSLAFTVSDEGIKAYNGGSLKLETVSDGSKTTGNHYVTEIIKLLNTKSIQGQMTGGSYGNVLTIGSDDYAQIGNSSVTEGVKLYFKGNQLKLQTTSDGTRTTGTHTATSIKVDTLSPKVILSNNDVSVQPDDIMGSYEFYSNDADGVHTSGYMRAIAQETYGRQSKLTFGVTTTNSTNAVDKFEVSKDGTTTLGSIKVIDNSYTEPFLYKTRTDGTHKIGFVSKSGSTLAIEINDSEYVEVSSSGMSVTGNVNVTGEFQVNGVPFSSSPTLDQVLTSGSISSHDIRLTGEIRTSEDSSEKIGQYALSNDDGSNNFNTAIGQYALNASVDGNLNVAIGADALRYSVSGGSNVAVGFAALKNTTSSSSIGIGHHAISSQTSGNANIGIGNSALGEITTTWRNIGIGLYAGRYLNGSATPNQLSKDSIYIGYSTGSLASDTTNEIVIGNSANGKGSNTVAIGTTSTTKNYFYGDIDITGAFLVNGSPIATGGETFDGGTVSSGIEIAVSAPVLILKDTDSTGAAQMGFISLKDSTGSENGWMGYGSSGNTDLTIRNSAGNVVLHGSLNKATGSLDVTGRVIAREHNNVAGVMDTMAYQFFEGRGWGYNAIDDRVFYNAAGGIIPFYSDTTKTYIHKQLVVKATSDNEQVFRLNQFDNDARAFQIGFSDTNGANVDFTARYSDATVTSFSMKRSSGDVTFHKKIIADGGIVQDGNTILNGTDTWLRTTGATGWYSATYGGGIYMSDVNYVKTYASKNFMANGVRIGRDFTIANRAAIRLDSNGDEPADILFGDNPSANETSWNGVHWALTSRKSTENYSFRIYRGSGNPNGSGELIAMEINPVQGDVTTSGDITAGEAVGVKDNKVKMEYDETTECLSFNFN